MGFSEKIVFLLTKSFRFFILPKSFQKIYRFFTALLIYKLSTIIIEIRLLVSGSRRQAVADGRFSACVKR